jgi:hypothetical protein
LISPGEADKVPLEDAVENGRSIRGGHRMRFRNFPFSPAALAALLLGLLTACTAVVVEDPGPGFGPGPRLCTREYDPVCAGRGSSVRTFGNECQAEEAGYRVIRGGECGGFSRPRPVARGCSREFDPVCARRGDRRQTFPNGCLAEEAGYRVIRGGECGTEVGDAGGPGRPGRDACTREYRPVCARRGPNVRTFGNECEARSADFRIISDGPC